MWTGDKVVADIKEESMEWINARIRRPAYIWWNFPASVLRARPSPPGPCLRQRIATLLPLCRALWPNPMEYAEASKIAIYGMADYAWNPGQYDAQQTWEAAIRAGAAWCCRRTAVFCCPQQRPGHQRPQLPPRGIGGGEARSRSFPKSYWLDGTWRTEDYQKLLSLTRRMQSASDILLVDTENRPLIEEITPWLLQFKLLGEIGRRPCSWLSSLQTGRSVSLFCPATDTSVPCNSSSISTISATIRTAISRVCVPLPWSSSHWSTRLL